MHSGRQRQLLLAAHGCRHCPLRQHQHLQYRRKPPLERKRPSILRRYQLASHRRQRKRQASLGFELDGRSLLVRQRLSHRPFSLRLRLFKQRHLVRVPGQLSNHHNRKPCHEKNCFDHHACSYDCHGGKKHPGVQFHRDVLPAGLFFQHRSAAEAHRRCSQS